jgi:uncharacterized protein YndB with AHSA1/START domain
MSRNTVVIRARPDAVFDVLTDAEAYGFWVVGAKEIRGTDRRWPRRGSRFHHSVGAGPATIKDTSKVLDIKRDRRLVLEARVRPFGTAVVELDLKPVKRGKATKVTMYEEPRRGPWRFVWGPVFDTAVHLRNAVALQRLRRLAETRAAG